MITIDKLKKNFGEKVAVDIEHYEINQGDMLGLVGNNGAGKDVYKRQGFTIHWMNAELPMKEKIAFVKEKLEGI